MTRHAARLPSSVKIAAERASVSAIDAKLSGAASLSRPWATAYAVSMLITSAATAARSSTRISHVIFGRSWGYTR
jgi:ribosomal protein L18